MLAKDWAERKAKYDFVVVGSGYGGSILAARISNSVDKNFRLCSVDSNV